MDIKDVKTICVVGAGNMGHQIALQCALYGYETYCTDVSQEMIDKAQAFAEKYLPERVAKGKLTAEQTAAGKSTSALCQPVKRSGQECRFRDRGGG